MNWTVVISILALGFSVYAFVRTHRLNTAMRELQSPVLEFRSDFGTIENEHVIISISNYGTSPAEIIGWTVFVDLEAIPQLQSASEWKDILRLVGSYGDTHNNALPKRK